jgi:hypothetical protein
MKRPPKSEVCYLCGGPMGRDRTRDHVPAQSFFPAVLRKQRNFSKLDVVYAHRKCNAGYSSDEQYFFLSLAPLAHRSEVGPAIYKTIEKPILTPREWSLRRSIANELYADSSGQIRKRFDGERVYRVAKKIVRGLHFLRWRTVLPDDWRYDFMVFDPDNRPPDPLLRMLEKNDQWGPYPEVFFFKVMRSERERNQAWVLFFWDWLVILVIVHESECLCVKCAPHHQRDSSGWPLTQPPR